VILDSFGYRLRGAVEFGPELNLAVFRGISPRGVLSGFLGEERGQRREKEQGAM